MKLDVTLIVNTLRTNNSISLREPDVRSDMEVIYNRSKTLNNPPSPLKELISKEFDLVEFTKGYFQLLLNFDLKVELNDGTITLQQV